MASTPPSIPNPTDTSDAYPTLLYTITQSPNPQKHSPLFQLPAKVLMKIYEILLTGYTIYLWSVQRTGMYGRLLPRPWYTHLHRHRHEVFDFRSSSPHRLFGNRILSGGLIWSCRKAYLETLYWIYEGNTFQFSDWESLARFQLFHRQSNGILSKREFPRIRHLEIDTDSFFIKESFKSVAQLVEGVQTLEINLRKETKPECEKEERTELALELLQLRGIEFKYSPYYSEEWNALLEALKEIVEQPRTSKSPLLLTENERVEAMNDLMESQKRILEEESDKLEVLCLVDWLSEL